MERLGTLARVRRLNGPFRAGMRRVRKRRLPIIQATIAAGLAYWVARVLVGHEMPFFAPIAAVIILGLSGGDRMSRAVEMSLGCVLGVGLGDLLFPYLGPGPWQIAVAVCLSLMVASFVTASPLVSNQMAIGSILIATIMPPSDGMAGPDRMIDAIVGSLSGLLVIAIIPASPLHSGRREVAKLMGLSSSVLADVSVALRGGGSEGLARALEAVRGSQASVNAMLAAAKQGKESSTLSPLLWSDRRRVRSLERLLSPVDSSIRNVQVLARRALILTEDGDGVSQAQLGIIDELADIALAISELYEHSAEHSEAEEIPVLVNRLRHLGARLTIDVVEGRVLSAYAMLAQSRSIVVDFLEVCGLSRESAMAVLAPTSATPAIPPELYRLRDRSGGEGIRGAAGAESAENHAEHTEKDDGARRG